jgi:hypothetical protein
VALIRLVRTLEIRVTENSGRIEIKAKDANILYESNFNIKQMIIFFTHLNSAWRS